MRGGYYELYGLHRYWRYVITSCLLLWEKPCGETFTTGKTALHHNTDLLCVFHYQNTDITQIVSGL
jgi:hypothetical protein